MRTDETQPSAGPADSPVPEARLLAVAQRAHRARLRRSQREYPAQSDVQPLLVELVEHYRNASEEERTRLRASCRASLDVLNWLQWMAGDRVSSFGAGADPAVLDVALAAMSLEDNALDFRDTYLILGQLWHRAHRRHVDPRPAIERAAALSSGGERGFAAFLLGLESSEFLREDVLPHLEHENLPYETP